jgi:hypothetical protein
MRLSGRGRWRKPIGSFLLCAWHKKCGRHQESTTCPPESCAMSEHPFSELPFVKFPNMLVGWRSEQIQPPPASDDDFRHSTSPEARMNLLLRFETDSGPRTIVAAGIPLRAASEIAHAMKCAGHFAELTDYLPPVTMAERMKHRRAEDAFTNAYSTIVEPPRPKQPTRCAAGVSGSHWSAAS